MTPFFHNQEGIARLQYHAAEWIGTPFAKHAMVCGGGVDCVHLLAAVYMKCGLFEKFETPNYSLDAGQHQRESQVFEWLDKSPCFQKQTEAGYVLPGDCLCFKNRLSSHHVGLLLAGKKFIHALEGRMVIVSSLEEFTYARRLQAVYRPVERSR